MAKPVTPQDMFDMWQKMVNPGAYPLQSLMFPTLEPKELEKKIAELAIVEHWLKANVNMVQLTVKSLQFQLAMVKGGAKAAEILKNPEGAPAAPSDAPSDMPNPAMWAWNMMAEAAKNAAAASQEGQKPSPQRTRRAQRKRKG